MKEVAVLENQTLLDFTVQLYGTADQAMKLVVDNGLPGVSARLQAGQILRVDATDNQLAAYFADRSVTITTGPIPPEYSPGGIGYMQITTGSGTGISDPFIVS